MTKALIFDFDGLIVDTESVWFDVYQEVLQGYGVDLSLELFSKCVGSTDEALYEHMKVHAIKPFTREQVERQAELRYQDFLEGLVIRDGVINYLKDAQRLGLKVGLASSSGRNWVEHYLNRFEITDFFDGIWTGDDVQNVKPDPELYNRAVSSLKVKPDEAIVFEDSGNGLKAAQSAGIPCVVVPNRITNHLSFEGYTIKISSMGDVTLEELFEQLNK